MLARSSLPPAALVSPAEGSCTPDSHGRMLTQSLRIWVSTLASNETFFFSFQWQCRVPNNSGHLKGKLWELGEQGPASQGTHAWHFRKAREPGAVTRQALFLQNSLSRTFIFSSLAGDDQGSTWNPRGRHRCPFLGPDWGWMAHLSPTRQLILFCQATKWWWL